MSVLGTAAHEEEIGGARRKLLLRNGEIERFEEQYAPFGIFELLDQLVGLRAPAQVRHCRDIVALGLIGGGMSDREADDLMHSLGPAENIRLAQIANRLLVQTFSPARTAKADKKKDGGTRAAKPTVTEPMAQDPGSSTSAA